MPITSAVQKGSIVYAYNGNRQLFNKVGILMGYTGNSLSVQRSSVIYTYDEKGRQVSSRPAK